MANTFTSGGQKFANCPLSVPELAFLKGFEFPRGNLNDYGWVIDSPRRVGDKPNRFDSALKCSLHNL